VQVSAATRNRQRAGRGCKDKETSKNAESSEGGIELIIKCGKVQDEVGGTCGWKFIGGGLCALTPPHARMQVGINGPVWTSMEREVRLELKWAICNGPERSITRKSFKGRWKLQHRRDGETKRRIDSTEGFTLQTKANQGKLT